jgi:signal transduction histidine kinase
VNLGSPAPGGVGVRSEDSDRRDLLQAVLALAADLELPSVLQRFVETCADLTGAAYAAINVLDARGNSTTFVQTGVSEQVARLLGHGPHSIGVLGEIPPRGVLRLNDLTEHPAFRGFPSGHPPMGSFIGASVRVSHQVFGHLYLAQKDGGFTAADEEIVLGLAAAAGVAVHNAQLYAEAARREHWLRAGQEITTMLLSGLDEEEALARIAATAREVAGADAAALALPGVGGDLVLELVDGYARDSLLGAIMPGDGRSWSVMDEGRGLLVPSLSQSHVVRVEPMRAFGPALFAPLQTAGHGIGVLILMRKVGSVPFTSSDLDTAESFAAQAALAFVLAEARHAQDIAALLDERERIARDLHDLAIQQLFATGMQLETVRRRAARGVDATELTSIIEDALDNVDGSVRQIRSIVHALRDPDAATSLVERLRRESSLARTGLGFAPSFVIELDGKMLQQGNSDANIVTSDLIDERVSPDMADDVVAVVREGLANAARHARASSVAVRITVRGSNVTGTILVEVEDDGAGLPPERTRHSGTHNLAARARQHAGSFSLGAAPSGRGTLLSWQARLG